LEIAREKFMKLLLTLFLLAFAIETVAQDAPNVKYAGSGQKRRVVEITNMFGQIPEDFRHEYGWCKKTRLVIGKVVKRDFDEDEVTITSFILADARDKRIAINFNQDQVGLLGHGQNVIISELLSKGNRVQVQTFTCSGGGSGLFIYAANIKLL
jgi:hypothetical protein